MSLNTGVYNDNLCGTKSCSIGYVCVKGLNNPNFGVTNFDNVFNSFLAVFQCITLEG